MYQGTLTPMDGDDAFTGHLASMDADFDFTMTPNRLKTKDSHPHYLIEARSPRGRLIRIGSCWKAKSEAGNDYYSMAFNLPNQPVIRVNAVSDPDAEAVGDYRIIPFAQAA